MTERWLKKKKNPQNQFCYVKKSKLHPKNMFVFNISSSYARILVETNVQPREFPCQKQKAEKKERKILQGLGVAQAAVTECWP